MSKGFFPFCTSTVRPEDSGFSYFAGIGTYTGRPPGLISLAISFGGPASFLNWSVATATLARQAGNPGTRWLPLGPIDVVTGSPPASGTNFTIPAVTGVSLYTTLPWTSPVGGVPPPQPAMQQTTHPAATSSAARARDFPASIATPFRPDLFPVGNAPGGT